MNFLSIIVFALWVIVVLWFSLCHWQRKAALGVSPLCQRREVVMDSALKEISNGLSDNSGAGGGVRDIYGEDRATEDQTIIPWTSAVAR